MTAQTMPKVGVQALACASLDVPLAEREVPRHAEREVLRHS